MRWTSWTRDNRVDNLLVPFQVWQSLTCWIWGVEGSEEVLAASQICLGSVAKNSDGEWTGHSGGSYSCCVPQAGLFDWTGFEKTSVLREQAGLSLPQLSAISGWTSYSFWPIWMLSRGVQHFGVFEPRERLVLGHTLHAQTLTEKNKKVS